MQRGRRRRGSAYGVRGTAPEPPAAGTGLKEYLTTVVAQHEKALIERALQGNAFNKSKTARVLGIARETLARKIACHQIACGPSTD